MKLDVTCMRYLTKEDFRVLEAIELGMRNHELVPIELIASIAKLRHGGLHKNLSNVLRYKLVAHANNDYNGYRLSYMGYDILALHTFLLRGVIVSVGSQIGVGKESDIFEALDENGNEIVLKIHRLGRTSFRSVRKNRDYMLNKSKASWLYMSRLAAIKEFAFMKALYAHEFPTPVPIDQNRHVVAMSRINGFPMAQIKTGKMYEPERVYIQCINILKRLAQHGLIHCDFNEFNLMVDYDANVTLIDFPQMVSVDHLNAQDLFSRDLNGLLKFFAMKMNYIPPDDMVFSLNDVIYNDIRIDEEVKASGYNKDEDDLLTRFIHSSNSNDEGDEGEDVEVQGNDGQSNAEVHDLENNIVEFENIINDKEIESSITTQLNQIIIKENDEHAINENDVLLSDLDSLEDENNNILPVSNEVIKERVKKVITNRNRRNQIHSRNLTKKRNKYGRIDKSDRNFANLGY